MGNLSGQNIESKRNLHLFLHLQMWKLPTYIFDKKTENF